tara:strand:+ start:3119 stop:4399 length:1281 start_codon:yes stop_codon:yes gene_type:complete
MQTLVITSINPYTKLDYQKACFSAWKAAGYSVRTLNCATEAGKLLDAGFEACDIDIISEGETSLGLFGKAIPRILPALNRAQHYDFDATVLTNSDIYPCHQRPVSRFLASIADTLAMTRNECVSINDHQYTDSIPYRGGLDIFFFTRKGLSQTFDCLNSEPLSERMTYGVPGWDFYLGHHLLTSLNGKIIDSEVFLHQSHKTTYNQISEFTLYAEEMKSSGHYSGNDSNAIAAEFSQRIHSDCNNHRVLSKTLKTAFYVKPANNVAKPPSAEAEAIYAQFSATIADKNIAISLNQKRFLNFIQSQLEAINWSAAESYTQSQLARYPAITGYLCMLLAQLLIKQQIGKLRISTAYPEGNVHGIALRQIINNTRDQERQMYLIRLFSAELVDHGIFNTTLFKYIVWSANSDYSLGLCNAVFEICKEGK